jgi:prepilin-type N-terminal cleavage/methylation domain-containing protein
MDARRGFNLIELMAVLAVGAILVGFAIIRMQNNIGLVESEAALLRAHLRYAQAMAMANTDANWTVVLAAGSYEMRRNGVAATYALPGESSSRHTFRSGVAVTAGAGTVAFNDRGSPGASDYTITLNGTHNVTVTRLTGYIP